MEQILIDNLMGASGLGAYGLVLLVLLACGLGVPLPEEVVLITGGFLVFKGAASLPIMMAVCLAGILGGDTIIFMSGRHLGSRLSQRWPFRRILTPAKQRKVEQQFARYGEKVVTAARFIPGLRSVTFFMGGAARMRYRRFILFDGIAAIASVTTFVSLGFLFGGKIDLLVQQLRRGQMTVLLIVAAVIASICFARWAWRRRNASPSSLAAHGAAGSATNAGNGDSNDNPSLCRRRACDAHAGPKQHQLPAA